MLGLSWDLDLGVRVDENTILPASSFYSRNIDTPEMQQIRYVVFVYEEEDAQQYADDPTILVAWPTRYTEFGIETLNDLILEAYEFGEIARPLRLVSMDDLFDDPEFVYEMIDISLFRLLHGTWRRFKPDVGEGNQSGADREICPTTTDVALEDELEKERVGTQENRMFPDDEWEERRAQRRINNIEHIIEGDYVPANRNVDLRTIERFVFYESAVYCNEMTFVIDIMHDNVYYDPGGFRPTLSNIRYSAEFRDEDLERLIIMIEASGMRDWEVCYLEEEVLWADCALIDGGFGSDWGIGILFSDGTMLRSRGCNVTHPPEEQFRILTDFVEKMSEEIIDRHNTEQGVVDGD